MGVRTSKAAGVTASLCAYAVALAAAWLALRAASLHDPLAAVALGDAVATVVVFVTSMLVNNSSVYDPYWSLQPAAIAGYYLWLNSAHVGARVGLVAALVFLYALRLTSNFYRDWPGLSREDFRYVGFRSRFGDLYWPVSFVGIHCFPTGIVYLGCLPLFAVLKGGPRLNWLDIVAAIVTLGAVLFAFAADEQLRVFRRDPVNKGRVMSDGLWRRSRHPNYLGEIAAWWGLYLFALAAGLRWWWTGIGAVAVTLMFVLVSVPMMERRQLATRNGYGEYAAETPALLPIMGSRSRRTARPKA
jgi:steroid 5-alpha reductase family enzyme